ncbi:unnamed protein product [Orchesella dallaii]|uniref:CARD domain-containing protein n=1 Tax=Orchesella dallaii TaxID=48710 RepID=A0ABP1QYG9_9HEXA
MEPWQASHIKTHLADLLEQTYCNTTLLSLLNSRGILSDDDISSLTKYNCGERKEQSLLLYEIVQTRRNSYSALIDALRKTNQSGSLRILEQALYQQQNMVLCDVSEMSQTYFSSDLSQQADYKTFLNLNQNKDNRATTSHRMKKHQIDHINNNLSHLIVGTFCNASLLSNLITKGILTTEEMHELEIKAKTHGNAEASLALYEKCKTRSGGFEALLQALEDSCQSGMVKILKSLSTGGTINPSSVRDRLSLPTGSTTCSVVQQSTATSRNLHPDLFDGNHQQRHIFSIPPTHGFDTFSEYKYNNNMPGFLPPKRADMINQRQHYDQFSDYIPLQNRHGGRLHAQTHGILGSIQNYNTFEDGDNTPLIDDELNQRQNRWSRSVICCSGWTLFHCSCCNG